MSDHAYCPNLDAAILYSLEGIIRQSGKNYCWPTLAKLQELANKFYGFKRSISTIKRHVDKLKTHGLIKTKRRVQAQPGGGYIYKSNLYILTKRALTFLCSGLKRIAYWSSSTVSSFLSSNNFQVKLWGRRLPSKRSPVPQFMNSPERTFLLNLSDEQRKSKKEEFKRNWLAMFPQEV